MKYKSTVTNLLFRKRKSRDLETWYLSSTKLNDDPKITLTLFTIRFGPICFYNGKSMKSQFNGNLLN